MRAARRHCRGEGEIKNRHIPVAIASKDCLEKVFLIYLLKWLSMGIERPETNSSLRENQ